MMIVYTIFKNDELIWARNFPAKDMKEAKEMLEDTIKDVEKEPNVNEIKFDGKKLEFNSYDEKHIMIITGE